MQTVTPISAATTGANAATAPQAGADDGAFPATLRRALPPADGNTPPPTGGNLPPGEAPAGSAAQGAPSAAPPADGLPLDGAAAAAIGPSGSVPQLTGQAPPAPATPNDVPPVLQALRDIAAGRSAASGSPPQPAGAGDAQPDTEADDDEHAAPALAIGADALASAPASVPAATDRTQPPLPVVPPPADPAGRQGVNATAAEATGHARAVVAGTPAAGRAAGLLAKAPAGGAAPPDARVVPGTDSSPASQPGPAQQAPAGTANGAATAPLPELAALGAGALLAAGGNAAPAAAGAGVPAATELHIAAPPGSAQFGPELGERLLWLVRDGLHEARLQLNPRELGPIEVRLSIGDGAAQASFSTQHAGTAAAVQQSLPQLRELLAQQGLQLGQATVSHQPGSDGAAGQSQTSSDQAGQAGQTGWSRGQATDGDDGPAARPTRVIGHGLVDAYA